MKKSKVSKHTAEPWHAGDRSIWCNGKTARLTVANTTCAGSITLDEDRANAARIVACVNACAGIADPSAVLDLVSWLGDAVNCLEQYRDYGESMREHGRGFQATGRIGHDIDSVISACHAAIAKVKP